MLKSIDESTLGVKGSKRGKPVSATRVVVKCDNCERTWDSSYNHWKTKSHKPDYCNSCQNVLGISGFKGRKHSLEFVEKQKQRMSGPDNPMNNPESVDKLKKTQTGRDTYWLKGKKRPEHAKKMKKHMLEIWATDNEYRRKLLKTGKNNHSKLHDKIKSWLNENFSLSLLSEQVIEGTKFIVDEVNFERKLIIEINGDFWHANPTIYDADDKLPHLGGVKLAKDIWERDHKRKKLLEQLGYKVVIIWESDWKDKNKRSKIKREINKL